MLWCVLTKIKDSIKISKGIWQTAKESVIQKRNLKKLSRMKQEGQKEGRCERVVKWHAERMRKSYMCLNQGCKR